MNGWIVFAFVVATCNIVTFALYGADKQKATTPVSDRISKDLKNMGCKFVGSTIIYSFMQAVGMVNDHLKPCFVYKEMNQ